MHIDYDDLSVWAMSPLAEWSEGDHAVDEMATEEEVGPMTRLAEVAAAESPTPTSDLFGDKAAASHDAPQDRGEIHESFEGEREGLAEVSCADSIFVAGSPLGIFADPAGPDPSLEAVSPPTYTPTSPAEPQPAGDALPEEGNPFTERPEPNSLPTSSDDFRDDNGDGDDASTPRHAREVPQRGNAERADTIAGWEHVTDEGGRIIGRRRRTRRRTSEGDGESTAATGAGATGTEGAQAGDAATGRGKNRRRGAAAAPAAP